MVRFFSDHRSDAVWAVGLFIASACVFAALAGYLGERVLDHTTDDAWFEADVSVVFANMTDRDAEHRRTRVHPISSIVAYVPVTILRAVFGWSGVAAVRCFNALVAGLWCATFFVLLRVIGCRRLDSFLFSLLGLSSAGAIFMFVVPETAAPGSVSILACLLVVAASKHRKVSEPWYVAASALSLGFTVTNWMAGVFAALADRPWRRALQISINAFFVIVVVWTAQKVVMPSARFFIDYPDKRRYMLTEQSGGPLQVSQAFVFHTMIMPELGRFENADRPNLPNLSVQWSSPWSATNWGRGGVVLWIVLLITGLWGLLRMQDHGRLRAVLAALLLAQWVLHLVYGEETFLFALHFLPLLLLPPALSTRTALRPVTVAACAGLVITAAINNGIRFAEASAYIATFPAGG